MAHEHDRSAAGAGQAVYRAVRAGKMPHASTLPCKECGNPAREYHHHNGYAREHWLDVIPLCIPCHVKADNRGNKRPRKVDTRERRQCEAMTKAGNRCYFRTEKDSIYCRAHGWQARTVVHYTEVTP